MSPLPSIWTHPQINTHVQGSVLLAHTILALGPHFLPASRLSYSLGEPKSIRLNVRSNLTLIKISSMQSKSKATTGSWKSSRH